MSRFKPAQRQKKKIRMAIDGPSGSGKTYTMLAFAMALARFFHPAAPRVAVICSERGSAGLYQGLRESPDVEPWNFDLLTLNAFSPTEYTAAIEEAGREGYDVLGVDSLTHAWAGKDGALELKDKAGDNNSFTAWRNVTPMHNAMIDAILQSPCHVLVTMRSKVENVLVDDVNAQGKPVKVPRRIGMAPIQRPGMEYEFDLYGSMDWNHMLTISKSRCPQAADACIPKPSGAWILPVAQWFSTGEDVDVQAAFRKARISDEQVTEILRLLAGSRKPREQFDKDLIKRYGVSEIVDLRPEQAESLIIRLTKEAEAAGSQVSRLPAPATAPAPTPAAEAPAASNGNGHDDGNQTLHEALAEQQVQQPAPDPGLMPATEPQLAHLKSLITRLNTAGVLSIDDLKKKLKARKVNRVSELSEKQADALVQQLGAMVNELNEKEAKEKDAEIQAAVDKQFPPADPVAAGTTAEVEDAAPKN